MAKKKVPEFDEAQAEFDNQSAQAEFDAQTESIKAEIMEELATIERAKYSQEVNLCILFAIIDDPTANVLDAFAFMSRLRPDLMVKDFDTGYFDRMLRHYQARLSI